MSVSSTETKILQTFDSEMEKIEQEVAAQLNLRAAGKPYDNYHLNKQKTRLQEMATAKRRFVDFSTKRSTSVRLEDAIEVLYIVRTIIDAEIWESSKKIAQTPG